MVWIQSVDNTLHTLSLVRSCQCFFTSRQQNKVVNTVYNGKRERKEIAVHARSMGSGHVNTEKKTSQEVISASTATINTETAQ